MTGTISQLKQQLPLNRLTPSLLLALRVLFDDPDDIVDLDQDIADLRYFPERLHASYRPEWETYILHALIKRYRAAGSASSDHLIDSVMRDVEQIQQNSHRYQHMLQMVLQAQSVCGSHNTILFPSGWRQQTMALMLPLTTAKK
ncbi:hypothetical protein [Salinimonas lutimaris]|uniref:hypothetical protein n=1 Tax=Salinimonas lutimaris TaxID=914153 RepID=UPI0010C11D3D|nr:hypothetical protein [Salinimonas lutimaris]